MKALANYSIETDQTVLLHFRDGHRIRVAVTELPDYLSPDDLARVTSAFRLRREFLRRHMPKSVFMLAASSVVAIMISGQNAVAGLWYGSPQTPATPGSTAVVRNLVPQATALPAAPDTTLDTRASVSATPGPRHVASHVAPPTQPPKEPSVIKLVEVVLPSPVPALPQPAPNKTPGVRPSVSPSPSPSLVLKGLKSQTTPIPASTLKPK